MHAGFLHMFLFNYILLYVISFLLKGKNFRLIVIRLE